MREFYLLANIVYVLNNKYDQMFSKKKNKIIIINNNNKEDEF